MLEWRRFEAAGQFAFGVVASDVGIRAIELNAATELPGRECESNPLLRQAVEQLRAYFAGALRDFDLTLDMQGTEFQRRVFATPALCYCEQEVVSKCPVMDDASDLVTRM